MKLIVAIIVYNRLDNLKEWLRCWQMCEKQGAELVVVHNLDIPGYREEYEKACNEIGVKYVPRKNIGMDIGAFQDICYGRLNEFPDDWTHLIWITDDVYPMSKMFVHHFYEKSQRPNIGVVCLEVSNEVKTHIRTTGFMIDRETARKLTFPADPITTKNHCYEFEHRSRNAFYEQIKAMGKEVVQVYSNFVQACLWDTHNRARFKRMDEHFKEFPK